MTVRLEICVDSVDGLEAAVDGGADRIELCSALALRGLSPSLALLHAAVDCPVPVYVMVRPRSGAFVYSADELAGMEREIDQIRELGFAGVVFGAGSGEGLDDGALRRLCHAAEGLGKTLHRVVDLLVDRRPILTQAHDLGFERILTSGGQPTALEGAGDIRNLIAQAPAGLSIMPGAGIRPDAVRDIIAKTGATEVHASAGIPEPIEDPNLVRLGFTPAVPKAPTVESVRALKALC